MTTLKYCGHGGLCRHQPDCSDTHCEGRMTEQEARLAHARNQPGETVALGVEAALPQSFTQAKAPVDWETVLICGAVVVTFTAVMALSVYKG